MFLITSPPNSIEYSTIEGEPRADITLAGPYSRFSVSLDFDENAYVVYDHECYGAEHASFDADEHTLQEVAEAVLAAETQGRN